MDRKNLTLSEDQKSVLDLEGNVVYVATTDSEGNEYFTTPENLTRGKVCVGWETSEVCASWGPHKVCLSWTEKKFCVEWQA